MRKFIDIWGDIARHLLSTCSNDLKSNDIPRKYRVEISIGGKGTIYQHLDYVDKSGVSSKILLQLVRRSILIEKPESTPKEKDKERTAIYQIRASLLPKYSTSFVRKNYLRVQSVEQFSKFLLCEDEIKDTLIDIETKDAEKEKANQEDLFNGL